MSVDPQDLTRLVFHALSALVLIAGVSADLYLAFLVQTRQLVPKLRAAPQLASKPFAAFAVQLTLFATLGFTLPALFAQPDAAPPQDRALIMGPLFYALAGFLVVGLSLTYARTSFREAFLPRGCPPAQALKRGLLYGVAAIPPVIGLSWLVTFFANALGLAPERQEVFDWLSDGSLEFGTRAFMLTAAVLIAPIVEELLFRGILLTALFKARTFLSAALISGAYFALVHFHAPSFLPLLALSVAFSAGYASTGSILTPMVMHALFNLTSVLFYFAEA